LTRRASAEISGAFFVRIGFSSTAGKSSPSQMRCRMTGGFVAVFQQHVHFFNLSSRALMATITVLADISTAPRAGVSSTPHA
jgi:hypothetical protein